MQLSSFGECRMEKMARRLLIRRIDQLANLIFMFAALVHS